MSSVTGVPRMRRHRQTHAPANMLDDVQVPFDDLIDRLPLWIQKYRPSRMARFPIFLTIGVLSLLLTAYTPSWLTPVGWFCCGTALFGLSSIASNCSNGTFTDFTLINHLVGWICSIPVLMPFELWNTERKNPRPKSFETVSDSYFWFVSSYVEWVSSVIKIFTRKHNKRTYFNFFTTVACAVVFSFTVGRFCSMWALCKYWLLPLVVYHMWKSFAIKVNVQVEATLLEQSVVADLVSTFKKSRQVTKMNLNQMSDLAEQSNKFVRSLHRSYPVYIRFLEKLFGWEAISSSANLFTHLALSTEAKEVKDATLSTIAPARTVALAPGGRMPPAPKSSPSVPAETRNIDWATSSWVFGSPLAALVGIYFWEATVWKTVTLCVIFYFVRGIGITAGYHRLFSHRSYDAILPVRFVLSVMGGAAFEGSVFSWCADHRAHHRHTDTDKDPYNINRGFFYAHVGWLLYEREALWDQKHTILDLKQDPWLRFQHKYYVPIAVVTGLIFPMVVAGMMWGDWWGGFFVSGILSTVIMQQCTFFINSLAHFWGDFTYTDLRTPRDSYLVSLVTFGEGYHNFHHEFPYDYRNGLRAHHYDPGKWLIAALEPFGATYNLKRFPNEAFEKGKLHMAQKRINQAKAKYYWGPEAESLPAFTSADVKNRCAEGAQLLMVGDGVYDVADFADKHPGGKAFIKAYIGKDATRAFNETVYNHSLAARHVLDTLQVGRLLPSAVAPDGDQATATAQVITAAAGAPTLTVAAPAPATLPIDTTGDGGRLMAAN